MKRFLSLTILAAGLAIPAHAQTPHGVSAGGGANPLTFSGGGGGGYGGGGVGGGSSSGSRLPSCPRAQFSVSAVSGTQQDYVPSTFVSYDKALAEGRDVLAAPPKTVAEVAHEQAIGRAEKAKLALVQDSRGNAIIVVR